MSSDDSCAYHRLGPAVLASQSVLLVSASSTFQAPFALSVATSVRYAPNSLPCQEAILNPLRIGNLLGEENPKRAAYAARTSVLMAIVIALAWRYVSINFLFERRKLKRPKQSHVHGLP